ncbi:MAG: RtcB family protein [Planctomycetota bacterium]|nr:RtcB family protein [Planctomycetota bacterium]
MKPRELQNLGIPKGELVKLAGRLIAQALQHGMPKAQTRDRLKPIIKTPGEFIDDHDFGELAKALIATKDAQRDSHNVYIERDTPAPWRQWGQDLEPQSVEQMVNACHLPIAMAGALMPDAHLGYGLPIGGVLATDNAIIPYAVGVDIACRMKMTVLNLGANLIKAEPDRLANAIESETRFGIGSRFQGNQIREHHVLDQDWSVSSITEYNKDKAWTQLGTSGSGNHFVEFGVLTLEQPATELGLKEGQYLALLSHSGSRGCGAQVANHYSKLAMSLHPELPKHLKHLAWLDLDSEAGNEYWLAMNLMGDYAQANHDMIHKHIAQTLKADIVAEVENHHNFAWKEVHLVPPPDGSDPETQGERREVIVHRKGATPAGDGVLGVIPGSMADPAYIVRGKGCEASLRSASHGAGRIMSRTKAKQSFTWSSVNKLLKERGVTLLSAGIDEVPGVYKNIDEVMAQQSDLVEIVARFDPKIVKMAQAGERPED